MSPRPGLFPISANHSLLKPPKILRSCSSIPSSLSPPKKRTALGVGSRKLANSSSVQGIARALVLTPTLLCCSVGRIAPGDCNEPPEICNWKIENGRFQYKGHALVSPPPGLFPVSANHSLLKLPTVLRSCSSIPSPLFPPKKRTARGVGVLAVKKA